MAKVQLGGRNYVLTPTGGAMRKIEQVGELTLFELFQAHCAFRLSLEEAAAIVHAGMEATGDAPNFGAVLDRVFDLRLSNPDLRRSIGEFLIEMLYHPDDAKNRSAAMTLLEHGGAANDPAT